MHHEHTHIQLVDSPIDVESFRDKIDHPDAGAQGWFLGVTRRMTGDRVTETLCYEGT